MAEIAEREANTAKIERETTQIDRDWEMMKELNKARLEEMRANIESMKDTGRSIDANVSFIKRRHWWHPFIAVAATVSTIILAALTAYRFVFFDVQ